MDGVVQYWNAIADLQRRLQPPFPVRLSQHNFPHAFSA
jgi:hypothetical protein